MKCGKKCYPDELTAENKMARAWAGLGDWTGRPLPVRSYRCNICNAWHLTSKPLMNRSQQIAMAQNKELA